MKRRLTAAAVAALTWHMQPAVAEEAFEAELAGHALLPAMTFVPAPAGAPAAFQVSGTFTGPGGTRVDELYALEGATWLADENAPRTTGLYRPFVGQPVQGFSGIRSLGEGRFLVLTDNGFGSKVNSPDAMLMFHIVETDWESGRARLEETVFLHDPDRVLPFRIVNEFTDARYLTGADFDVESIQPAGDLFWIGDEFGPYLFAVDGTGKVTAFHEVEVEVEVEVDGEVVRSPDNHGVRMPSTPGEVTFAVRRSRGFEGMAVAPDASVLYPMFEGPLWDADAGAFETDADGREYLRIIEFDLASQTFTARQWKYRLGANGNNIGDFNMIDETRALVIERDNREGDPRLGCEGEVRSDCFNVPAEFKRVYLIDMAQTDDEGFVAKLGYVDLMNIQDTKGVALKGTIDGVFTFPFVTIEDVDIVDDRHIVVANDNNLPFSTGRTIGAADDNEFILLNVGDFLSLR